MESSTALPFNGVNLLDVNWEVGSLLLLFDVNM